MINRFFWPDESPTAMLATDLAEDLTREGHEVHVVCGRSSYVEASRDLPLSEVFRGIHIHRLLSTRLGRGRLWKKLADLVTLQVSLHALGPWVCRPDAIFVMTDPPMALNAALWIRALRGGSVFHHVDDVYPDIAVALGVMRGSAATTRLLEGTYRSFLGRCSGVFVLGDRMAELIREKGVPEERIFVTPPWADGRRVWPIAHQDNVFRRSLGLAPDDVVVMYSGNMGMAHSFETIARGLAGVRDRRVHAVFIGGGARRDELERALHERGAERVTFLPHQPRERLAETLSAGDVHLISQDVRTVGLLFPSKLAGILAAGRPSIFVGDPRAEIARVLMGHDCGRVVGEEDVAGFSRAVTELADDRALALSMGARARARFEAEYERAVVTRTIADVIARSAEARRAAPARPLTVG